ncbi:hypothetical protein [Brevundimonas sp.]|uniref:hypothetical protein n=1 Tax=Brevundimonas sp. TaxID=1871086 RepID=UPI002622C766|nr:hypothetical protein [Brevundimonas sp.]
MLTALLVVLLATAPIPPPSRETVQEVPPVQARTGQADETAEPAPDLLEDVVVEGRPLAEATTDFIDRIAAPARGRGAATWYRTVCIGVGNLERNAAEFVIDRISTVVESVGLTPGRPRCEPRVFIVFASDADAAARDLVEARGRQFRIGVSGTDLGDEALEAFQTSDRPVRWWQSSIPINSGTGRVVSRLPGQAPFSAGPELRRPSDFGPQAITDGASRIRNPVRDDLSQVIIIVDIDRVAGVDLGALADYLALISLAQIDPALDPGPYDTILSLFSDGGSPPPGLTDWDRAFLRGLYSAEQTDESPRSRLGEVATGMARIVRGQQAGEDEAD